MKFKFVFMFALFLTAGGLTAQEIGSNKLSAIDNPPQVTDPIKNIEATESEANSILDLALHFDDPDNTDAIIRFEILANTFPNVAVAVIENQNLNLDFLAPGQTNIVVQAISGGLAISDTFAVGVRPVIQGNYEITSFDDNLLNPESYWNGSEGTGEFTSGAVTFFNDYYADWFSWSGWGYSNITDNTTAGYDNQYSSISKTRLDSSAGPNYGISYASPFSELKLTSQSNQELKGFFVTNSTYTALSMKHGDAYSKKFGGPDGTDSDYLKLTIEGSDNEGDTSSIVYYLADFTEEDNSKDYIIETWQWVDLSYLGKISKLNFSLSSTDTSEWGMNTPAYFCMDNLYVVPDEGPQITSPIEDIFNEPGSSISINLLEVFNDPDDDNKNMDFKLVEDSWDLTVINPLLKANNLVINLLADGNSALIIKATSNNKSIEEKVDVLVQTSALENSHPVIFNLYPNPSDGNFRISSRADQSMSIAIFDLSGKLIYNKSDVLPDENININACDPGTYLLKIETRDDIRVKRIIVQ